MGAPACVFFDLDDTILVFDRACDEAWETVLSEFAEAACMNPHTLKATVQSTRDEYWSDPARHQKGRMSLREARREVVGAALGKLGEWPVSIANGLADAYSDRQWELMRPMPGALETLARLRADGIPLGLITNGQKETQRAKMDRFGLEKFFGIVLIEGEQGMGKPDRKVYERALSLSGAQPGDTIMIGDNLEWDVYPPMAMGMRAVWHNPYGKPEPERKPHATVTDMAEAYYSIMAGR